MLPIFTTGQVKDGIDSGDLMLDLSEYIKKKDAATKNELSALTNIVANKLDAEPQHKHHISDVKELQEALNSKYDTSEKYSYNVILSDSEKIPFLENPRIETLEISKNKNEWGYRFYVDNSSGDLMILAPDDLLIATYSKSAGKWFFETDTTEIDNSIATLGTRLDEQNTILENHSEALNAVCGATLVNITDIATNNSKIATLGTRLDEQNTILENHSEALNAVCGATLVNITDIATNNSKITTVETLINDYIAKTDAVLKNHYDALLELCQKHGMIDGDGDGAPKISPE